MDTELQTAMADMAHNLSCALLRIPMATDERINRRIREAVERDTKPVKVKVAHLFSDDAHAILECLNAVAGRDFKPVAANLQHIQARLNEGAGVFECNVMIQRMVKLWGNDPKMRQYLRPETLFNATKFQGYYQARHDPLPGEQVDQVARDKQAANLREKMRYAQGTEREALRAEIQRLEGGVR
jgi:uncharacterized phage protein (TIGR02220 family)